MPLLAAILLAAMLLGAAEPVQPTQDKLLAVRVALSLAIGAMMPVFASRQAMPVPSPRGMLGLAFGAAPALSVAAVSVWPFSADEYGYVYLADTLLRGRLWNAPLPVAEILDLPYIAARDGKVANQYPPGWSCPWRPAPAGGEARQAVFRPQPETRPAIVLVPSRRLRLGPWQRHPQEAAGYDLIRNGQDLAREVLHRHARTEAAARQACRLPGYRAYRWVEPGRLDPIPCDADPPGARA
ncbi:hypothetical protein E2C06_15180 [Dankookia rubra]|uniref:Uncharacterized protein n=1 Tax=Dankookia rubra TaxID=1442381 RepID=A0A4R5QG30_9PROT|nr:hypothetical protein [Dankookia rubra]TDH61668.1 hypothetical protein E2C06_15180 [Dankookia rubra]